MFDLESVMKIYFNTHLLLNENHKFYYFKNRPNFESKKGPI
jgi:hypothetical protein